MEEFVFMVAFFGMLVGITGFILMIYEAVHEEFVRGRNEPCDFQSYQRKLDDRYVSLHNKPDDRLQ